MSTPLQHITPEILASLATQSLDRSSQCILWLNDQLCVQYANALVLSILDTSTNTTLNTPISSLDTHNTIDMWHDIQARARTQGPQEISVVLGGYSLQCAFECAENEDHDAFSLTSLHPPVHTTDQDEPAQARSRFLARMSHELRTPLNSVLGYAKLLEIDSSLDEEQRHKVTTIHQSGTHLLNLINDILDLSRADTGHLHLQPAPFHLLTSLHNTLNLVQLRANRKRVALHHDFDQALDISLNGDSHKIRQILINLLTNAIKFTEQGRVVLHAHLIESDETSATVSFTVKDTGIGIPNNRLKTIFAPFRHIPEHQHTAQQGAGLGLNISQRLARLMGGSIEAQSAPNQGSSFSFTLQLPIAQNQPKSDINAPLPNAYEGPIRSLLIVDDNPNNRALLRSMLSFCSFKVQEVSSGLEALNILPNQTFDAVLLDLHMPQMDGFETVKKIRTTLSQDAIPTIIACSSSVSPHDRQESIDAGFDDFIPRPVQTQTLLDTLQHHLTLRWVYAQKPTPTQNAPEEYTVPPSSLLSHLHTAAQQGRVRIIKRELKRLQEHDTDNVYTLFWNDLRNDLRNFDIQEICTKTAP